ncbi:MAG: AAA family ATPase [Sphaerochaeta sp.]|jgi:AAA15 family ATPase/GTPase
MLKNIYSFGEEKEFNMIPAPRFTRLKEHKYQKCGIEILKMASFYGANGAGKSNLIRALDFLRKIVVQGSLPSSMAIRRMKHFHSFKESMFLAVEFISNDTPYVYGIEIGEKAVLKEELYISGLGKEKDELVFERSTESDKQNLKFSKELLKNDKIRLLKDILEKNLIKQNRTALKIISELDDELFIDAGNAFRWFNKKLMIITPEINLEGALADVLDTNDLFNEFVQQTLESFGLGIKKLVTIKKPVEEFFGEDNKTDMEALLNEVAKSPHAIKRFYTSEGDPVIVLEENGEVVAKQLKTEHENKEGETIQFDLSEESDGSRRLIDYLPFLILTLAGDNTFIIDEIERSIHPLLIKEIVEKFSTDNTTKGQIIFTTHESNLLDQQIFRQDEIWFVEKDSSGSSDLYSLCEFKEHNTKDIRKGYLNGRYGSIPFLANLKDLNWGNDDFRK